MAHPDSRQITRWLKGTPEAPDRRMLRHVLQCPTCRERALADLDRLQDPTAMADLLQYPSRSGTASPCPPGTDRLGASLRRISSDVFARAQRDHQQARLLFDELMALPPARQQMRVRNGDSRHHSPALAQALLQRSREVGFDQPEEGERLARLGLAVVEAADTRTWGERLLADLRGRAWAHVGNAQRQREHLDAADESFRRAAQALEGTADPLEEAAFLHMLAALRRAQRSFQEAERLLRRAAGLYRQVGDREKLAQALTSLGSAYLHASEPEAAMEPLMEAHRLVDAEKDPRTALYVLHNLILGLLDTGRVLEAQRSYLDARPLYARFGDRMTRLNRRWLEANLALHTGRVAEAERVLLEVRDEFREAGQDDQVAAVSLDLATLYAQEERTDDLRQLVAELTRVFRTTPIRRDARAAFTLLSKMAQQEQTAREVMVATVKRAAVLIKRSRQQAGH